MTALLVVSSTTGIGLVMRDSFGYVFSSRVATLYDGSCGLIVWSGDEKCFSLGTHLLLLTSYGCLQCDHEEINPWRHARHWICRGMYNRNINFLTRRASSCQVGLCLNLSSLLSSLLSVSCQVTRFYYVIMILLRIARNPDCAYKDNEEVDDSSRRGCMSNPVIFLTFSS